MHKMLLIILSTFVTMGLIACNNEVSNTYTFKAKVVESNSSSIIVEPLEDEEIRRSSDRISIALGYIPEVTPPAFTEGTLVEVEYDGNVKETYPAQVDAISLKTIIQENETTTEVKDINESSTEVTNMNEFIIEVNGKELTIKAEDNSSSKALIEKLQEGEVIIEAQDYGNFEKVGSLGFDLPRNDMQYTTKPGDVILYMGNQLTIYYDTNSWNFTKLGEVTNVSESELKEILGDGNVTLTLKLKK